MVSNSLVFFAAMMASYFLFFYNAPYWTAKDMADMSSSGIWRAFFRLLSIPGYVLYKLYRFVVVRIIDSILAFIGIRFFGRTRLRSTDDILFKIGRVIDVLFFTAALSLVTYIYNGLMDGFFPEGISDLAQGGEGLFGKLCQAVVFLRVVVAYTGGLGGASVGNAADAVVVTVTALVLYTAINTFYFSVLFGFLRQTLDEVELSGLFPFLKQRKPEPPAEGAKRNVFQELLDTLVDAFKGFCNKLTVLYQLRDRAVLVLFLMLGLAFSFMMTSLSLDTIGPLDVIKMVFDSVGIVQLIGAFIVTWLMNRAISKGAAGIVRLLPEGIRRRIQMLSDWGNDWADGEDDRRHKAAGRGPIHPASADPGTASQGAPANEIIDFILNAARAQGMGDVSVEDLIAAMETFEPELLAEWRSMSTPEEEYAFLTKHTTDILAAMLKMRQ